MFYSSFASFKKITILNTVTSLAINSIMDIFLQVLQNFQNRTVFKTIFKNKFCQLSKSECMLSWTTSSFENCMYLKLTYLLKNKPTFQILVFIQIFGKSLQTISL